MIATSKKKIAICGFNLESNRFAPACSKKDFEENMYFSGKEISIQARSEYPSIHLGVKGFYAHMDEVLGGPDSWQAAPTLVVGATPAGPVEEKFFLEYLECLETSLRTLDRLDGVYICQHGAAVATHTHDPDGDMFFLVRKLVGQDIPIIATLDLHANVSEKMVSSVDMLIGYKTNPHIDLYERGEEAASAMIEMFSGVRPQKYHIRLPLVAPSVTQRTAPGFPYGDLIRLGETFLDSDLLNVTILSGFAFSDTPKNGMSIITHSRSSLDNAQRVAEQLASAAWQDRERYKLEMYSLGDAVAMAKQVGDDTGLEPLLFADPADNPGGGGRGNTTFILEAFLKAGVKGCTFAVFFDEAAVQVALSAGVNSKINITLNAEEEDQFSNPLPVQARVVSLHSGSFVGCYGMAAGTTADTGATAVLDLGGIFVICISKRQQCRSSDYISAFGIDASSCRSIVVKSRGHFRAGFQHLFSDKQIIEVDVPGLTSPNLSNFGWKYLPRPVYPLDNDTVWGIDEYIK